MKAKKKQPIHCTYHQKQTPKELRRKGNAAPCSTCHAKRVSTSMKLMIHSEWLRTFATGSGHHNDSMRSMKSTSRALAPHTCSLRPISHHLTSSHIISHHLTPHNFPHVLLDKIKACSLFSVLSEEGTKGRWSKYENMKIPNTSMTSSLSFFRIILCTGLCGSKNQM